MNNNPTPNKNTGGTQRQAQPQANRNAQAARPANAQRPVGSSQQRPAGAQQAKRPAQPQSTQGKAPNGKKGGKKNRDFVLAVLALVLVVALAITILVCCIKAIVDTVNKNNTTTGSSVTTTGTTGTTAATDPVYPEPVEGAWNEGFTTVSRNNTAIHEGDLILVNGTYAYTFPSTMNANLVEMWGQPGRGTDYVLGIGMTYPTGSKSIELSNHIVTPITTMLAAMKEANATTLIDGRRLSIQSGYRTLEKQEALYAEDPDSGLIAKPGHSEHHTGLTFDIRIDIGAGQPQYLNATEQAWIKENCAKYGFILRYTTEKESITGILNEDWHFRYVGVAHANYMTEHNLCLEEYIAFLRENHNYAYDAPLNYTVGEQEYTIYYFPASVENDVTNIYVPSANYEISGNNVDGFIVTITK